MKSNFSEQDLKERALELLYGLLEEDEAEELRLLIASDATAARIFDEARETVDRFARAARWEETPETEVDETAAKNVAVEAAPFDGGASFLFDSALSGADAFSANVDAPTAEAPETDALGTDGESSGSNRKRAKRRLNLLRKNKTASKNSRSETGDDDGKRGGEARKERRRAKSGKSITFARTARTPQAARATRAATAFRFRFGSKGRVDAESGWATVGRTASGDGERRSAARRFWARVPKPTLFQNLIIALAVVALSTVVGFWAQESALQARFRDDFRIQIAAPRTLARGESQTIAATTTGPNGKPRRVPIRFSFSDAETGAPLLAHTESGDASGVARFKIPDVSDFPPRTLLTISAGEREKETFETILTVVDAPKANVGANAAARFAASEAVEENGVETGVSTGKSRTQVEKSTARRETINRQVVPSGAKKERAQEVKAYFSRVKTDRPAAFDRSAATSAAPASGDKMGTMSAATDAAPASGGGTIGAMGMGAMGAMGGMETASAAPVSSNGMGATGVTTDAPPTFNFARTREKDDSAAPTTMGAMGAIGMDASNDSSGAETSFAVAEEAPSDGFDRAVAELESAVSNDGGEALELAGVGKDRLAFDAMFDASEKRGLDVRFYPVGGRLVAGRENVVWFECVDEIGRPVVGEFALNDSEGRVATAKTSEGGVGTLRWTPDADETYSLETAFDGKIAKIVETDKNAKTAKTDNGKDGDKECVAAEEAPLAALALNDSVEDWLPASTFETFRFPAPTPTVERVSFSVASQALESGKGVELDVWVENETPLAATVEKNGVALAQRVWTAKKGRRRVVVPLDANVSGALNVSLWNCARTPFEKVGSAAVYRKSTEGAPTLRTALERNDAGERALRVAVDSKKGLGNAATVRLEAFWAPTLDAGVAALDVDETLLYASDERRVETLATLAFPEAAPPVLFDNLIEMKARALQKLNAFWLGEAGLAGRVVGLGFLGCGALAALTIFCVVFGALKARRGAVVVLFCAALATFFYFERRRIDFSETLSEAIAVSVDESRAAQKEASAAFKATVANDGAPRRTAFDGEPRLTTVGLPVKNATKPAADAEWSVPLTGAPATTETGFILTKIVADDGTRAWKAIPLAEGADDGEGANR